MADFKEHSPIEEEPRMPERDSSLDDFEKLENIIIQDKTDDILIPQDLLGPSVDVKLNNPITDSYHDFMDVAGSTKPSAEFIKTNEHDLLGDFNNSDSGISKKEKSREQSPTPLFHEEARSEYYSDDFIGDLLTKNVEPPTTRPTERLLQFDNASNVTDEIPRHFSEAKEKLVHPPSDSGYVPSPVEESALGDTETEEENLHHEERVLPSSPKIAPLVAEPRSEKLESVEKDLPVSRQTAPSESTVFRQKPKAMATEVSTTSGSAGGCPFSPSALFDPNRLNPIVTNLVYWRDPKKSGIVFGVSLLFLLCLRYFSFITVVSYLALGVISVTLSFRIYRNILQAVQKSTDGHPFKDFLEHDISIPQEKVHESADMIVDHVKTTVLKLRSLFLVEDLIDSIKLGIVLWCLTYLGAWFNGLTLITLVFLGVFSLPKVYETNKAQVDQYLGLVCSQVSGVIHTVKSKIPFGQKEKAQ